MNDSDHSIFGSSLISPMKPYSEYPFTIVESKSIILLSDVILNLMQYSVSAFKLSLITIDGNRSFNRTDDSAVM